jgi:hypothetical protein
MSDAQPVVTVEPVERSRFGNLPGRGPGRPRGSMNKITRIVRDRMAAAIESGKKTHPAEVLLDIANDRRHKIAVRMRAASDLLPYFMPQRHSLEIDVPDPVDEDEIQRTKRLLLGLFVENKHDAKPVS